MGVKAIFQKFEASSLNRYGVLFGIVFRDCRATFCIRHLHQVPDALHNFWVRSPRKREIQQNSQYFTTPCTKCARGGRIWLGELLRGSSVLPK